MHRFRIALFCAAMAFPFLLAHAATIGDIRATNLSEPDRTTTTPGISYREFATDLQVPASAQQSGLTSTLTSRFSWFNGYRVEKDGASVPQIFSNLVEYSVAFEVLDPLNAGYTVDFDTAFRGWLSAAHESFDAIPNSYVFPDGALMSAELSVDGTSIPVTALATDVDVVVADEEEPLVEQKMERYGSYDAGTFFGKHVFKLTFSTVGANVITAMSNYNWGEGTVRFGLGGGNKAFHYGSYPTPDGTAAQEDGHFLSVRVTSLADDTEVPEPGTMATAALGLVLLAMGARRRGRQPRAMRR